MGLRTQEYMALDDLIAVVNNEKGHEIDVIDKAIARFGYNENCVIDERTGLLHAGHGRVETLKQKRERGEAPPDGISEDWKVPVTRGWASANDAEATAARIAANQTTIVGGWLDDKLFQSLNSLDDLDGVGFTLEDLNALAAKVSELPPTPIADPDHVPAPPKEPVTKLGDIWLLSAAHRVICGDSTDVSTLDRLLKGEKVDLIWTDPPYGVAYVGKTKDALTIKNDKLDESKLRDFLIEAFDAAVLNSKPGACWYVAAPPGPLHVVFAQVLRELGVLRQQIIWVKDQFVLGHSDYHYRHEPIFYGWAPGESHQAPPTRDQDTVWEISRPKASKDHPTMKPVELIEKSISNSTNMGGVVLDIFGGSGSTLIACHSSGRSARLAELDPGYCDVICKRFQEATGIVPILESTGEEVSFLNSDAA